MSMIILLVLSACIEQKTYTPAADLKLATQVVPVSRQYLVLVGDYAGSSYFNSVQAELHTRAQGLAPDEQLCIFPELGNHTIFVPKPECPRQLKPLQWVMPEIKPPPYNSPQEGDGYRAAATKLQAELDQNEARAKFNLEPSQVALDVSVRQMLWEIPVYPYADPKGSLKQLLRVRGETGIPVTLEIYSTLQEDLSNPDPSPPAVNLFGVDVQVHLLAADSSVLAAQQAVWDPWFQTNYAKSVAWSVIKPDPEVSAAEIGSQGRVRPLATVPERSADDAGLPLAVEKPVVDDFVTVVRQGGELVGR